MGGTGGLPRGHGCVRHAITRFQDQISVKPLGNFGGTQIYLFTKTVYNGAEGVILGSCNLDPCCPI